MLDQLAKNPHTWNTLRWIVEAGYQGERDVIASELAPLNRPGARFLDLGCGTGAFSDCFRPEGYVGIDLARHYVGFAGAKRSGSYSVMSGAALGLADESFDGALVLGVLHHLPDELVREVVSELWRVLRPGATALVMEDIPPPDGGNPLGQLMHWADRGGHIRTDDDYRALFAPYLTIERTYTMRSGVCDYAVYVLRRAEEVEG